MREYRTLKNEV